ncbi:hypothetical protein ACQ46_gp050 [Citrobacter phage Moon]|uniref:Uncharacterized protein n=1 Tax=Citrobacter phage Moon TaxID=1540095 RepID=A0A0A0YQ26_9CAUD|nr:hypothetical protein ACQ46_gp050 [Citrobacter phage Moon]AIX12021.1 hypothetical protein CPT_Moon50 [Citrobacter phage Moon]
MDDINYKKLREEYGLKSTETIFDLCEVAQEEFQRELAIRNGAQPRDVLQVFIFIRTKCEDDSVDYKITRKTIEI